MSDLTANDALPPPHQWVLQHQEWLRRFAYLLTRNLADADDLYQETFLRAIEHPPTHAANHRGWLRTVMTRIFYKDAAKIQTVRAKLKILEQSRVQDAEHSGGLDDAVAKAENMGRILGYVMALPEIDRKILLGRPLEQMSFEEIAEAVGMSEAAVRQRHTRAIKQVIRLIRRDLGSDWKNKLSAALGLPLPVAGLPWVGLALSAVAVVTVSLGGWWILSAPVEPEPVTAAAAPEVSAPAEATALEPSTSAPERAVDEAASREEVLPSLAAPSPEAVLTPMTFALGVRGPDGRPAAGVEVVAQAQHIEMRGFTDQNGWAFLEADPAWTQTVHVFARGPHLSTHLEVPAADLPRSEQVLDLEAGAPHRFQVFDRATGAPLAGADFSLGYEQRVSVGRTDAEGFLTLTARSGREHRLRPWRHGLGRWARLPREHSHFAPDSAADLVRIEVETPPDRLEATAVDDETGAVLPGAVFSLLPLPRHGDGEDGALPLASESGRLRTANPRLTEPSYLLARATGYSPDCAAAGTQPSVIRLRREAPLRVHVLDPDDRPAAGAQVEAWFLSPLQGEEAGQHSTWVQEGQIGEEGTLEWPAPADPEGILVHFKITHGDRRGEWDRTIPDNRHLVLHFEPVPMELESAPPTQPLAGRVRLASGEPPPKDWTILLETEGRTPETLQFDADGGFGFPSAPLQEFRLTVRGPRGADLQTFDLFGPASGLQLDLAPMRTIRVRSELDATASAETEFFWVHSAGRRAPQGKKGPHGRAFLFENLPLDGGWVAGRRGTDGELVVRELLPGDEEVRLVLRPGRTCRIALPAPELAGERMLPENWSCVPIGSPPSDPRAKLWRQLDEDGLLLLVNAGLDAFQVQLWADGAPVGEPLSVPSGR